MITISQKLLSTYSKMKVKPFSGNYLFTWISFLQNSKFRIYHATPESLDDFIPDNADEEIYLSLFGGINADIIVLGHTHRHYAKQHAGKRFINPAPWDSQMRNRPFVSWTKLARFNLFF